ncbi:hypothetical protein PAHAL_2G055700 [Panicum hallii]|uniref:Meg domain-containing protein n=1 Tax=Panicum hallii TaxID=206008 RepID=A0A2S3GW54_9POAL|nr:protein MATERNALLY EXPRESSED GENE 1-like [Panicum hallii]PAN09878.1 hypothetical protein PAHAL_2G055700 [Panicum hallii]
MPREQAHCIHKNTNPSSHDHKEFLQFPSNMEKHTKNALVFLSLLLLGYFAAHAQGQGVGEAGAPVSARPEDDDSRARCAYGELRPCRDHKCWCCINGRSAGKCFATQSECSQACF